MEEARENCFLEEEEEGGESYCCNINKKQDCSSVLLSEPDLYWEDDELSSLFAKQEQNHLFNKLEINPSLAEARREAVHWMLKVNAHYSFTALTAVLAVNYLDRFLFSFHFQTEKPWMTQLTAVACLSLAAKVEETQVPLLLDLQVHNHVFSLNINLNHWRFARWWGLIMLVSDYYCGVRRFV